MANQFEIFQEKAEKLLNNFHAHTKKISENEANLSFFVKLKSAAVGQCKVMKQIVPNPSQNSQFELDLESQLISLGEFEQQNVKQRQQLFKDIDAIKISSQKSIDKISENIKSMLDKRKKARKLNQEKFTKLRYNFENIMHTSTHKNKDI